MQTKIFFSLIFLCLTFGIASAQSVEINKTAAASFTKSVPAKSLPAVSDLCPGEPCPCTTGYQAIKLYYFGEDNVDIDVYSDNDRTNSIASFPGAMSGDLLTISAASLSGGILNVYTYITVTNAAQEECYTDIYTRCPKNVWPEALRELQIVGKTFGDFTVFSVTDDGTDYECDLSNADQDWRVGGNVVAPDKNTLGTLNAQDVTFISDNTPRGILLANGDFGIGTLTPDAQLEVEGDVQISETLDVEGITTVHSTTASTDATNGALVVAGGAGIGGNTNVGQNLNVDGNATIANDLTVEAAGMTTLENTVQSTATGNGALVVQGGAGIARNLNVGEALDVDGSATVGGNLRVEMTGLTILENPLESTLPSNGALVVSGGAGISRNLNVGGAATIDGFTRITDNAEITGNLDLNGRLRLGNPGNADIEFNSSTQELLIENTLGEVVIEAADEEMLIISNSQVEAKKRLVVTGADLAERFTINIPAETDQSTGVAPGMVLSIDVNRPGELIVSDKAYDKTVAGIVSGAGGIQTAMLLGQEGTLADGDISVAMVGRVYCYVDADYGRIQPGDLLTTSSTFGHAMKVADFDQARGAIIGKAMTGLDSGKGLVLVLISMQ